VWLATLAMPAAATLELIVQDAASGKEMPARIHLRDAEGKVVRAPGLPFWRDHFVMPGRARVELPAGPCTIEIERGPEWSVFHTNLTLSTAGQTNSFALRRLFDLRREGWYAGETHVHRPPHEMELLMQAEDLDVAHSITWWNTMATWKPRPDPSPWRDFDGGRVFHDASGEDERDGGALLFLDASRPLPITSGTKHFPSSLTFAKQGRANGIQWIDAEKPFWWDFPMWIAHGVIDTVGLAHNHMHRGGVLNNEAWGRPRPPGPYPGPQGNARWTQDIYYHVLNAGIRLPPSAGSASGVLPNPVGYNRAFVHLEEPFTWKRWADGLKAGRSFVGNGPLLRVKANGQWPGHVFRFTGPSKIRLEGRLDSRDPIAALELIQRGKSTRITLPSEFEAEESGWFLIRAIADVPHTFRFASTAPFYVEVAGKPMRPHADSVDFFRLWCRERIDYLEKVPDLDPVRRQEVLTPWKQALEFWSRRQP